MVKSGLEKISAIAKQASRSWLVRLNIAANCHKSSLQLGVSYHRKCCWKPRLKKLDLNMGVNLSVTIPMSDRTQELQKKYFRA
ncbi:hypothetical protein [Calothrix sp. NIES-2098]|uniref:hypothetical protein n=1 Tax=Calothrix sp. NIES-2098 TaxID=1954171 RepID=UPI0030DBA270